MRGCSPTGCGRCSWTASSRTPAAYGPRTPKQAREAAARSEERTRIAREVHDVVGHHLSAIRLQAVGGRRGPAGGHPEADRVLGTIADLSHEALGDIRTLLDRLRLDTGPVGTGPVGTGTVGTGTVGTGTVGTGTVGTGTVGTWMVGTGAVGTGPAGPPGLDELPALAARLGGDGLRIDVVTDPQLAGGAAAGTGSCAYRVVQEALTNVVRHSRTGRATVHLDREGDRLVVTVDDPGPPHPELPGSDGGDPPDGSDVPATPGRYGGLHGMAERVAALGGTVAAGRRGRGWRVRAVLPLVPAVEP